MSILKTYEQGNEFENLCKPLVDWLRTHGCQKIIIQPTEVTLHEKGLGIKYPETDDEINARLNNERYCGTCLHLAEMDRNSPGNFFCNKITCTKERVAKFDYCIGYEPKEAT